MNSQAILCLSLVVVTTQLSLRTEEGEVEPNEHPMMDFGGIFDMHDAIQDHFSRQAKLADNDSEDESMQLIGGRKPDGLSRPEGWAGIPNKEDWDEFRNDWSEAKWPKRAWKAPLAPGDNYPGKSKWPLDTVQKCSAADVKLLNFWALKQAKKRLPSEGYNGSNFNGVCFRRSWHPWAGTAYGGSLHVGKYAECFQEFYNVSLDCAQCVGKVYNMAFFNWSLPCYNFCKGRPNRRDGPHWCWEDCQSCMWYIGKQLTTCYGEPYDMMCRYARELGKEEWFEQNGINPKR